MSFLFSPAVELFLKFFKRQMKISWGNQIFFLFSRVLKEQWILAKYQRREFVNDNNLDNLVLNSCICEPDK